MEVCINPAFCLAHALISTIRYTLSSISMVIVLSIERAIYRCKYRYIPLKYCYITIHLLSSVNITFTINSSCLCKSRGWGALILTHLPKYF